MLLALLMSAAAYGPPSDYNALEAIKARYFAMAAETTMSLYQYGMDSEPHFPLDVRVAQCERVVEGAATGLANDEFLVGGQLCIVEITPNLDPPYVTSGVFHHDGYQWRYYGPLSETVVMSYDDLVIEGGKNGLSPKPGSLAYEDRPSLSNHNARSPYDRILDGHNWWKGF